MAESAVLVRVRREAGGARGAGAGRGREEEGEGEGEGEEGKEEDSWQLVSLSCRNGHALASAHSAVFMAGEGDNDMQVGG
eukprot:767304-Hanusia_phi.AAC.1